MTINADSTPATGRDALLTAAIACSHSIDEDRIVLHRDRKKDGNALHQLGNRLDATVAAREQQLALDFTEARGAFAYVAKYTTCEATRDYCTRYVNIWNKRADGKVDATAAEREQQQLVSWVTWQAFVDRERQLVDALKAYVAFANLRRTEIGSLSPEMEAVDAQARAALIPGSAA